MEKIFTNIYESNILTLSMNSSGDSSIEYNRDAYVPFIRNFIIDNKINFIVDLGCGDLQFGKLIYDDLDILYVGYDTYKNVLTSQLNNYHIPKYTLIHLDIYAYKYDILCGDLCIIKDVLQHWPLENIYIFLDYLVSSKRYKYILICNSCNQIKDNTNIECGNWHPLSCDFFPLKKYNAKKLYKYNDKEISVITSYIF